MTTTPTTDARGVGPEPIDETNAQTASDLQQYRISSHQHTTYEWHGYRYSNSSDAIAAAKRAAR